MNKNDPGRQHVHRAARLERPSGDHPGRDSGGDGRLTNFFVPQGIFHGAPSWVAAVQRFSSDIPTPLRTLLRSRHRTGRIVPRRRERLFVAKASPGTPQRMVRALRAPVHTWWAGAAHGGADMCFRANLVLSWLRDELRTYVWRCYFPCPRVRICGHVPINATGVKRKRSPERI